MVNGSQWSRLPTHEDAEDTEFRFRYTNTDILYITKNKSQKCDQEPILKIHWSCLSLPKHCVNEENAVCEVEAPIQTGPLDQ